MTTRSMRTALTWIDSIQFEMARQVLEEEGIPFDVHGNLLNSTYDPIGTSYADGPVLRVRAEDLDRARQLLRQTVGRGVAEDPPIAPGQP